jgi:hypothetical protein
VIIGISGKALSGKDTIANFLVSNGYIDRKIGFGDNLKHACKNIFNLSDDDLFTQNGKKTPFDTPLVSNMATIENIVSWMSITHDITLENTSVDHLLGIELFRPRDVLQFVGTDVMRYLCPTYHSDVVFSSIKGGESIVISDVRFPNEADLVSSLGGWSVRVNRPIWLREKHGIVLDTDHPSETSLDHYERFSFIINNNSDDLQTLYSQIVSMMSELRQKWGTIR